MTLLRYWITGIAVAILALAYPFVLLFRVAKRVDDAFLVDGHKKKWKRKT